MDEHPLSEYRELLDELTDAQIADMADRPLDEVAAYRAEVVDELLGGIDPGDDLNGDGDEPVEDPTPSAPEVVESPPSSDAADLGGDGVGDEPAKAPKPDPAPPAVRVRRRVPRNLRVRWHDGTERPLYRRDIYSGKDAAHLWAHARKHVEPYPPREG